MTDYAAVLTREYSGREWSINANDYATLVMHDGGSKPTKATLDSKWAKVQHEAELERVKAARNVRYQAETDPLFFKAQRSEDGVTMTDWQAAVDAIRAELPYPTAPEA